MSLTSPGPSKRTGTTRSQETLERLLASPHSDLLLLTLDEVGLLIGADKQSVYRRSWGGQLKIIYLAKKVPRVRVADLRAYLDSLPSDADAAAPVVVSPNARSAKQSA